MKPLEYINGKLYILDQRELPTKEVIIECTTVESVAEAIKDLAIRGAPLIAISAAYGVCVGLHQYRDLFKLDYIFYTLKSARPTAYNIFFILEKMENELKKSELELEKLIKVAEDFAFRVHEEDRVLCEKIAENALSILPDNANVITYCNTGKLATGGIGTALGVIYKGYEKGKIKHVYVCETRPLLQGSRLTAFELHKSGIPYTLITDNMVAFLMSKEKIDLVIVGADRIVRNGDTANKIGTLNLAILCNYYNVPLYVAAPYTTIDRNLKEGGEIEIELRIDKGRDEEVKCFRNVPTAPRDAKVWNPAFDITPSKLITAIITEKGIFKPSDIENVY